MASSANLSPARRVMESAMKTLRDNIAQGMKDRGKVATGGTIASMVTTVNSYENIQGNTFGLVARLEANDNWKFVGNGRGPGGMPPVQTIQAWITAKGLTLNAWAVAKKMAKQGSRDFRLKRTNIFTDEIDGWAQSGLLEDAANGIADALADTVVIDLQTGLR